MAGAGTRATVALTRAGVAFTVHDLEPAEVPAGYGRAAAAGLGVDEHRVLKTLVAEVDGRPCVAVVPVSSQLDLKALAAALGAKRAVLAGEQSAERRTGYVLGGISPFGQRQASPTVVDASAFDHPTVFVSGGRRWLELEVEPSAFLTVLKAMVAPVAR